jgi:predicted transcriptional regulator
VARPKDDLDKLLGRLEADLVRAAWAAKRPVTVRDLLDRVNQRRPTPLAYTTVMTVLTRLTEKGVMHRKKQGRGFVYEPVAGDSAALAVHGVMRDFGDAAVAHFVEEAKSDPALLRRLQQLLAKES